MLPICQYCNEHPVREVPRPQGGGNPSRYCSEECRDQASKEYTKEWRKTPRGQYVTQRDNAKRRVIEWLFTFETWLAWWGDDLPLRGRGADDLCMARFGDEGPYSPDNCRKLTGRENHKERQRLRNAA